MPAIRETIFNTDEGPRPDTSLEALAKLKPAFHARGVVTAGNSSQTSDGAAAAVVMSASRANELGILPMARFVAFATSGCLPEEMGVGPVYAIPKALKLAGLTLQDIDLIELNEAFAAQSLAVLSQLDVDLSRVNVNGGAIALGHPLGCTGAKLDRDAAARDETSRLTIWLGNNVCRRGNGRSRNFRESELTRVRRRTI